MTLGKVTTWEHALPSAKAIALGKVTDLPSVTGQALGKGLLFAECLDRWHSAEWPPLPSV